MKKIGNKVRQKDYELSVTGNKIVVIYADLRKVGHHPLCNHNYAIIIK